MKMNLTLAAVLVLLLAFGCSKEPLPEAAPADQATPISKAALNEYVMGRLQENSEFRWAYMSGHQLWSAVVQSDSVVAVGYQPIGTQDLKDRIHEIDLQSEEWTNTRTALAELILAETQRAFPGSEFSLRDLMPAGEEDIKLPYLRMKIFHQPLLEKLREMPQVRYVEPMSYTMDDEVQSRSDAGCGYSPASSIPTADFTTVTPNAKVPWNFYNMNIPAAWQTSTGAGISVLLIDTGTSPNQPKLGSQFNSGASSGRFLQRYGSYVSSIWPWVTTPDGANDLCGHGTQMAGLIAAPRGTDGTSVGVAYNANLLSVRGTSDVVVNGWREKDGVAAALYFAGNRSDVKVVSMSIGDVFYSSVVADGIFYAYNMGKMLIAAAGTSTSFTNWYGVIFPAYMAETVAVTGIKDGTTVQRCNTCHSGSEVDFVAVMQRASNDSRTSLTLALSGNQPAYVGGSSAATATTAGIAALVWATNPNQTRAQVLQRMKNASRYFPGRNSEFGWGTINAANAVK